MKNSTFVFILIAFLSFSEEGYGKGQKESFPSDIHVFVIGFDGWGSYSMPKAEMPVLKRMMTQGCWTLKKRSVLPSLSAPNWASMFMGASPEIHGYTKNNSKPDIPSIINTENQVFPTISQLLRKQKKNAEIGLFYQWNGVKYFADTLSINHVSYLPPGKSKDWSAKINKAACKYIKEKKPLLCTILYSYPDHFGHATGYDSNEYYESLKVLDKSLDVIIQAVKDAGILDKSIFIVTSDHGGIGKKHGGKTLKEMETPFVVFGCNIKKGHEINEFMMQYDVAATIAYIFGLDTPQAWIGRPVLSIFKELRK